MHTVHASLSAETLIGALEADSLLAKNIVEDALQANTLDRVLALLWMFETKIYDELYTATLLWPLEVWTNDNQRACRWIHSTSLAIQMVYRDVARTPRPLNQNY